MADMEVKDFEYKGFQVRVRVSSWSRGRFHWEYEINDGRHGEIQEAGSQSPSIAMSEGCNAARERIDSGQ